MAQFYFLPRRLRVSPRLTRIFWRIEAAFVGLVLGTLRRLPPRLSAGFAGSLFARVGVRTSRAHNVRTNLSIAFPQAGSARLRALTRGTFRHLGVAMSELSRLDRIWRERARRIEFVLHPGAVTPEPARPTIFVTAHLGAWQLTPLIGPRYGLDVPVIYAPESNPYVDRRLIRLRAAFGGRLVSKQGGIRVLMRALDAGESIGLTGDTRVDAGELLPFFGEDAATNTVPARLALRYGYDLVPVLAERLPRSRYRIHIYPPITASTPAADIGARARDMTAQLNAQFEHWIQAMPDEWICMRRRWPKAVHARAIAQWH